MCPNSEVALSLSYLGVILINNLVSLSPFLFFKILLFIHERHGERQRHRQKEMQPDVGLNSGPQDHDLS